MGSSGFWSITHNYVISLANILGCPPSSWCLYQSKVREGVIITCVQPFKNKALRPPQPLTRAWIPSLVTWSHQEMFNCSNSGHPSLRNKTKRNKHMTESNSKGTNVSFYWLFHNNKRRIYQSLWCSRGTTPLGGLAQIYLNKLKHNAVFQIYSILWSFILFKIYSFCTYHNFNSLRQEMEIKWFLHSR